MSIINTAAYKFTRLNDVELLRVGLEHYCAERGIRGTILLSEEGINIFVAGPEAAILALQNYLKADERFADLHFKHSPSPEIPFERLKVKIRDELISMRVPGVEPNVEKTAYITPEVLKQWLDEGKDFNLIDTRNQHEIDMGAFAQAKGVGIDNFREFPEAVQQLPMELHNKPAVIYCTGGIRCEKAGVAMQRAGFKDVYQLHGGILHYFEKCGGAHFSGTCFVFDDRIAVDTQLQPIE